MYHFNKKNMKKKIYIILIVFASIFNSCEKDFLNVVPDNIAVLDNAFANRANAIQYLYGVYSTLPSVLNYAWQPGLLGGDEIWLPPGGTAETNYPTMQIAKGLQSATSPYAGRWNGSHKDNYYIGIRNANIFISRIDDVLEMSETERRQWKAEAKFLKAYYHFKLIQMYGPVIIADNLIPISEEAPEVLNARRNTIDESFNYVIQLMDETIEDLPLYLQSENSNLGRITRPIAAALKARVAMYYASPLFNGNGAYSDFVNSDGERFFPVEDASKWDLAATACKEAIDMVQEVGVRLYQTTDFDPRQDISDFTLLKSTLRSRVTEEWNKEIIWGDSNSDSRYLQQLTTPRLYPNTTNGRIGDHCATLRIAEMYYSENGVPIEEDVNYNYQNRYKLQTATDADLHRIQVGEQTAVLNFNREPRFYADLGFDRGEWYGNARYNDTEPWFLYARSGENTGIQTDDFQDEVSATGYWIKKLVKIGSEHSQEGAYYVPYEFSFPLIRLADLYLYYAEALNEVKSIPDAEVYEYIDLVRDRAGLESVVDSWNNNSNNPSKPTSKDGMREIIQQERMIELSFEAARFWDLRRWKLSKQYMNEPIRGWNIFGEKANDYYNVSDIYFPKFDEKNYLWPIPEGEIIQNPNLDQNPGW